MEQKMSAATKRALENGYFEGGNEWFTWFSYTELKGDVGYEEGVIRRDPSSVILVDGVYYVYYTKSDGDSNEYDPNFPDRKTFKWDLAEVWYATSTDGFDWKEQGCCVTYGEKGAYDERSVFTPEILAHEGKYYLTYQCATAPHVHRTRHTIGMAIANSPKGPFTKLAEPILRPADNGKWLGDDDNRFAAEIKGDFDSCQVHDPSLHYYKGEFYLYYKGERMGEAFYRGGREIKWGVAIAKNIEGPYVKSEYNPITNSGHETCLWEYNGGMAALVTSDGMEKNTIQYSEDGINFHVKSCVARLEGVPHAAGPFRLDMKDNKRPLDGLSWGISMTGGKWDYLIRFDLNEQQKNASNDAQID